MLSPVDERRVVAEADVVQEDIIRDPAHVDAPLPPAEGVKGRDRVVAVEPDVAREVVAGPERDADEGEIPLDRDLRNLRKRSVASGHPERLGVGLPRELRGVVVLAEGVDVNTALRGGGGKVIRAR
jgi:hypothetical protein